MFSKMLVATDLSQTSDRVVCALEKLKQLGTREACLVHVFNIRDVGPLADRLMELAKPSFERQKKMLEDMGYQVTAKMVLGLPQIEINRLADDHNCSLVVVGASTSSIVGEIFLGGVASAVLHSATRPTLLLRLQVKDRKEEPCDVFPCDPLEHVLFPTDFSDNAEHAFAYVRKIASCGAKRITLLHVQDQGKIDPYIKERLEEFNRIDTSRLERLQKELKEAGAQRVELELLYGLPKKIILERIRRGDVSLVVMGSQGRGVLAEMLLGSVSHAVARHSPAPVLLIPPLRANHAKPE